MTRKHRRRSGSMFRLYFIQTSVSVLLCLSIASIAVLLFFVTFWKNDRLSALDDDALGVAQSVESYLAENPETKKNSAVFADNMQSIMSAVASTSATEIFLSDKDGKIIVCYDSKDDTDDDGQTDGTCFIHSRFFISDKVFENCDNNTPCFHYEGKVDGLSNENYLVSISPTTVDGETLYIVVMQTESVALLPYTTEFVRMMIFVSLIAITLSCVLSIIISYRMVRPLKKITEATKLYSHGDFSVRINTSDVYNELTQLVDSVNKMADNLAVIEESRSSFVANVSHELKTPMTVISGFIDGMLDGTIPEDCYEKYLTIVSDEVKRLSRLVVAMLNMSKIEAGKLTLNLSVFSMRDMFIKTLLGFEKMIDEKNISVEGADELENVFLQADETLINQIIYNLLDNAIKFTSVDGTVTLKLKEEKKDCVFSVKNTGKGIEPDKAGLIFDRFYKVDQSRGLDAKSFGMGLYIVKSIIELHGGTIKVNSEENEYCEFEVRIPLKR